LTSVSWLTTFFITAAEIPRVVSTVRVYDPTGTVASPITSFTPGFVRPITEWIPAGFDFGTMRTSVLWVSTYGLVTRPLAYSCSGIVRFADAKMSAGAPWVICAASVLEPPNE